MMLAITIITNAMKLGMEMAMIAHNGTYMPFLQGCRKMIRIANSKQIQESIKRKAVQTMVSSRFHDAAATLI